jgi:hypothetical protein
MRVVPVNPDPPAFKIRGFVSAQLSRHLQEFVENSIELIRMFEVGQVRRVRYGFELCARNLRGQFAGDGQFHSRRFVGLATSPKNQGPRHFRCWAATLTAMLSRGWRGARLLSQPN